MKKTRANRPNRHRSTRFVLAAVAVGACLSMAFGGAVPGTGVGSNAANAATAADFDPGNIVSDDVFYDSSAMGVQEIQSFLNARIPQCRAGYTCLRDFRQDTTSQPARAAGCSPYPGASQETAAAIIQKVGASCGVNPQVLLVLLEKEQSLVTDTWPTAGQYRSATGYGCPDSGSCDSQYYGLFNQLYNSAWQFKKYRADPTAWGYQANRWNTILWNPNRACGTSQVFIQNQATAGLYIYTPYRPNQAALDNMYGVGDSCSSYGNRNFYRLFSDWFGDPKQTASFVKSAGDPMLYLVAGAIKYRVPSMDVYDALSTLGTYRVVPPSYLDAIATSPKWANDAIRDARSGAIFLTQGGSKNQFPDCDTVALYGLACADAIDLTPAQLGRWSTGPLVTRFFVAPGSSDVFMFVNGGRARIYDWPAVVKLNGGTPPFVATLRASVAQTYPVLHTLLNPQSLVKSPSSDAVYFVDGLDRKIQITSFGVASEFGASGYVTVPDNILSGYATADGYLSILVKCDDGPRVAAAGRISTRTGGTSGGFVPPSLSTSTCGSLPLGPPISGEVFVKAPGAATVYLVDNGRVRAIGSWDELLQLNQGRAPVILNVSPGTISAMQLPARIAPGTVTRSATDPMLYLIDDDAKVAVSSFVTLREAGLPQWSFSAKSDIDAMPTRAGFISRVLECSGKPYFAAGGVMHLLAANSTGLASTPLGPETCARLTLRSTAALNAVFVKTPDASTVYLVSGGLRHAVSSWQRLVELAGTANPAVLVTGTGGLDDLASGDAV